MAALNFPPSPSTNQIYTANGKSWRFDGTSWKTYYILNVQGGGTGNTFYNLGDILVGAGTSLYPLPVGSNNFVLTADNSAAFGVTWRSTAATGITTLNSLTATQQYFSFGYSGSLPNVASSGSTHTFNIPIAGSGATGLVSTLAQTIAGQKTFTSAIIGDLTGTATTAGFASTANYAFQAGYGITSGFATTASYAYQSGYGITAGFATTANYAYQAGYGITAGFATTATYSYQSGYGITAGFATTASYSYQAGYGITAGFATTASYSYQSGYGITSGFATTASYAYQAGYGLTAGFATTASNINVNNATSGSAHPLHFSPVATGSGVAVSSNATLSFNPSTSILAVSGLAVTSSTISLSTTSGALIVTGGVGIGGSLFLTTSVPSSLSGVVVNNGVITNGSWAGSLITGFYGGTGYNTYTKGDILVGAGSTFIKLGVGSDSYVLTASSSSATGLTWSPTAATGLTTLNGLSVGVQYLSFGYSGTVPAFSSSGSTHTLNIPIAGTGSTGLVSTQAQSFAGIKTFTNAVYITDNTGSGSYTSGALVVTGGVGIGGTLNVQGDLNVQGTFTTINSTTITVADKNIELGVVSSPSDLTAQGGGITLRGATDKSINWYSGVGWSSSESWNLASGNTYKIAGTTVLSSSSLGIGVTNSYLTALGTITTGFWSATAITALYGGTGLVPSFVVGDILYANTTSTWGRLAANSNSGYVLTSAGSGATPTYVSPVTLSVGYATTSGFASTASYSYQSGYGITSGFATTATYAYQSGYAITSGSSNTSGYATTSGLATTSANLNISNAATGIFYPILSNTASSASGIGASVNGYFSFNASTGAFGATSVNILSGQSYSVGGNSVLTATSLGTGVTNSSLTALGTITTGVWAGSLITAFYGGTGYNSYTKGDILVGSGNTFIKLNVGTDNFVLTADAASPSGVKWSSVAGLSITSVNGLTASAQYFSTGTSGTGFNISSSGSTHTFNIPIAGTGATGLVSTLAQSFAGTKTFTGDVIISSTTGSTAFNTGSLTIYGGLGVSGQLSFNQAALGYTGATNPSMAFIGSTTAAPITLTVLSDNSLLWEGTSGKLFGINNNLSSGWIFNVGDISGLPIIRANADGTIAMAEFTANVGIGLSNPSYKLHVVGDTNLSSGYVYRINGVQVLSSTSLGTGVTNSSLTAVGTLSTGVWAATAITAYYGGTGYNSYTKGDILVGAGNTFIKLNVGTDNYVLTASSTSSTGLTWSPTAATGLTTLNGLNVGIQYFAFGYSGTVPAFSSSGSTHTLNIPLAGSGSTGLISTQAQTIAGQKTFTSTIIGDLSGTATTAGFATTANYAIQAGYAITSGFATTASYSYQSGYATTSGLASTATLALTVSSTSTSANADYNIPFFSGTALSTNNNLYYNPSTGRFNAFLHTGTWAGNTITSFYGGTGFSTYSTGDLLVGAGSTITKIAVGTNNFILVADSTAPGGIKWASAAGIAITNINGLTASKQDLAFGYSGTVPAFSSSGSTHTLNIPLAGTGSTGLVSTQAQSFAGIKTFTNAVNITDNTGSGSYTSGALVVSGGVGIGGTLNVQGDLNVQGTFTTINSTTITVADKNIELGVVTSPTDLTAQGGGITLRGGTDKSINWYSGVGWSSSESWNLASGNTYKINGGIVLSATSLGTGITNSNLTALGTITTGTWSATAITALYGGTGLVPSFTVGDILYANTATTWGRLPANSNSGYVLTSAGSGATPTYVAQSTLSVGLATTATYAYQSGYAITSGIATTATNLNTVAASTNTNHYILFTPTSGSASGVAVSSDVGLLFNPASNTLTTNTFSASVSVNTAAASVTGSTVSISPTTGALVVTGGVGIGGSLYVAAATAISGVTINNGVITGNLTGTATTATTSGFATTSANLNVVNAASGTFYPVLSNTSSSTSGIGASVNSFFSFNAATGAFGATSVNILAGQSYSIGGNSVLSATSLGTGVTNSSLTAVGIISTGTWAGSTITARYGGTGYTNYTKGDLLVGNGSTFVKFGVGSDNQILIASSFAGSGLSWAQFSNPTYGSFYSSSTQPVAGSGVSTYVTFNGTYEANRVAIIGGSGTSSRIQIQDSGPFSLTFSAQINLLSGTQPKVGDMWFRINGVDQPLSNTEMTITGKDYQTVLTVNFVYTFQSNDYVEIMMSSSDANFSLESKTSLTSPPRPDIPSIILSVLPITHVVGSSGTATSGIQFLNGLITTSQYFVTGNNGTDFNISSASNTHTFNIPDASATARGLITTGSQTLLGSKTFASGVAITAISGTASTSTGALVVTGGVGIGQTLFTSPSYASSVSGVVLNNGVITSGAWAGSTITGYFGGTGYNSYTKGDILVGAGSTFIKLPVGINGYVLGADSSRPSGLGWTTVSALTVSDSPPASPKNADLWFNSLDGGLLVYYSDVDTNQWVEIALGSGIDLSQPVHITNATPSTSTSTGALIVNGGAGIAGTVFASSFSINGIYDQISSTLITSATTPNQVALSLDASSFRTAKMFVQVTSGSNYHSQEILMVHDGSQVYMTEYAMVNTGAIGSTFDGDISGGNMRFLVTPTNAVTTYKIACSAMRI